MRDGGLRIVRTTPGNAGLWSLLLIAAGLAMPQVAPAAAAVPAPAIAPAAGGRLAAVQLDGNYFTRDGQRFLVLGAHWVPAKAAMQWPLQWDPQDIEADFAQMARMGFNTVRLDLMWAWFEPRPGDYNPEAFAQFDALLALAHKYHIYLHPSLVRRRRSRRSLLGRALAHGPQSAVRSGDAAPRDQPGAGIRPPLCARDRDPRLGPDR